MGERWLLDFKVDIQLADGQWVHLHTVRDPVGAAFVGAALYRSEGKKAHVELGQVQATLRQSFAAFGLPEEVQTDWEPALHGQAGDPYPARFTLWLVGLGITHRHSRPGVPTDAAAVERAHRTLYEYALVGRLGMPFEALGALLAQALEELNQAYPSRAAGCGGRPPFTAHPELLHPARPFAPAHELALFELSRVDAYLAAQQWVRKVGRTGQITLGGSHERYTVGRGWAGQHVLLRFDPAERAFVAAAPAQPEQEIARWPARHLEVADLVGFSSETPCPLPQQLPLPFQPVQAHELTPGTTL